MGIKKLEKFMRKMDMTQKIDIRHEIKKWQSEHNRDPTIVIDVKELARYFISDIDVGGTILGGRFSKLNEILDYFFGEMKNCHAKLVFIEQLDPGRMRENNAFMKIPTDYDCLIQETSLKNHLNKVKTMPWNYGTTLRPGDRIIFNLLNSICPKYGEVYTYYRLCKASILSYARQHEVMAIITRNTEYFIHDGEFEYWSLSDVHFCELKIARFSREQLYDGLGLNQQQMQLLHAVSNFTKEEMIKFQRQSREREPLLKLVDYVKSQQCGPNGYDPSKLTGHLTQQQQNQIKNIITRLITINSHNGNWEDDVYEDLILELTKTDEQFNSVLLFCKKNIYFAYKLLNEKQTTQKDLLYMDIRRPYHRLSIPFIDLVINVWMKQLGVLFKDVDVEKQPKTRTVKIARIANEEAAESEVDIIYPTMILPSLKELIVQEEDHSFDESRWTLLQWLLGVDKESISSFQKSSDSKYIHIVRCTLKFLQSHGSISRREANNILLAESEGHEKINAQVPRGTRPVPQMPKPYFPDVDITWVHTAHRYTISFELVCHCLEICGLRRHTDIIQFDAFEFHANMANKDSNERLKRVMDQLQNVRL